MPSTYKVAHIQSPGSSLIIVPFDNNFQYHSPQEQNNTIRILQDAANKNGTIGKVVAVWENEGAFRFMAPPEFHKFLKGIDMRYVMINITGTLHI